jgi:hypothetical protein
MPDIYKIGMTKRTPYIRLYESNIHNTWKPPTKYTIEFAKKVLYPKQKETTIHKLFSKQRINKKYEFFKICITEVKTCFDLIDGEYWLNNEENHNTKDNIDVNLDEDIYKDMDMVMEIEQDNIEDINENMDKDMDEDIEEDMEEEEIKEQFKDNNTYCGYCKKNFYDKSSLTKHQSSKSCLRNINKDNNNIITFDCEFCSKKLASKQSLCRHLNTCKRKIEINKNFIYTINNNMINNTINNNNNNNIIYNLTIIK